MAALQVVYGHCLTHYQLDMPMWLTSMIGFFHGVPIFFTLSGFLIWFSIGRSKTFSQYCQKRFWRIYPELWVAVLVEVAVLLMLYRHDINWSQFGAFVFGQLTIFQFWTPDCLRDYGVGCPNGSLWTICVLIQYYFVSYFTYKVLHKKGAMRWLIAITISMAVGIVAGYIRNDSVGFKLFANSFVPYYWMFLLGGMVAEYREKILPLIIKYWYIPIILNIVIMITRADVHTLKYGIFSTIMVR